MNLNRREILTGIGGLTGGLILSVCSGTNNALAVVPSEQSEKAKIVEVTAAEDLMREHGVLRRALFVYSETAAKLRKNPSAVPSDALTKTAHLFRAFGEDYHEKKLEEAFIFPAVKKALGPASALPDILASQHNRGREITDYIIIVTESAVLDAYNAESLALAMDSFVRMYRPHAAIEDTVVFPAWKQTLTAKQLDEMNDKFEDIEHQMLGDNGFENAVKQISDIEKELGMSDLSKFTAPSPPSK